MKLAIVGFGKMAEQHLAVFRALGVEVVASANRSEAGRARAKAAGIPKTVSEIEALFDSSPDAVLCSASIHENFAAARRVLPWGVPTLLEKPPGICSEELMELIALTARHGTLVMLGLNRLHYSVLDRALADAGGIGSLTSVHVEWSEDPRHLERRGFSPAEILRRTASNGIHGLSLLTYLGGAIPEPHIVVEKLGEGYRFQTSLHGRSERGLLCTFRSTWDAPDPWSLSFTAPGRSYRFSPLETCSRRGPAAPEIEPAEYDLRFKPGLYRQAQCFIDAVAGGRVPEPFTLPALVPAMALADRLSRAIEARAL